MIIFILTKNKLFKKEKEESHIPRLKDLDASPKKNITI